MFESAGASESVASAPNAFARAWGKAVALATRSVYLEGNNAGLVNTGFQLVMQHYQSAGAQRIDRRALAGHIDGYLRWMHDRCADVTILPDQPPAEPGAIPASARAPIDSVFLPLDVIHSEGNAPCQHLLTLGHKEAHLTLLAEAGQGKTMTLVYLARQICAHLMTRRDRENPALLRKALGVSSYRQLAIPFYVPLSVFAEALIHDKLSLSAYLDREIKSESLGLPDDFFSALIAADKPVLLLLDGLDEILEPHDRERVAEHISNLAAGKRHVRFIVACRTAAYSGNSQLSGSLVLASLAPFTAELRDKLVKRVCAAIYGEQLANRKSIARLMEIDALEQQRQAWNLPPLIDSPLMTVLAIRVSQHTHGHLPEYRAKFLDKAVESLLNGETARNSEEGRMLALAVGGWERHRILLAHVAQAMIDSGVNELGKERLRRILLEAGAAEAEVKAVLNFADARGGPLRKYPDLRYKFVHKALQQILGAAHLAASPLSPGDIARTLANEDRIAREWTRETAYLLAGLWAEGDESRPPNLGAIRQFLRALAAEAVSNARSPDARFACAEVVLSATRDYLDAGDPLQAELPGLLAKILDDLEAMDTGPLAVRLEMADLLTAEGDPRPHVMTLDAMRFCYVPPGPFLMGSDGSDPEAQDSEKCGDADWLAKGPAVSQGYLIGEFPVSNAQFGEFIADPRGYANKQWWTVAIAAGVWEKGKLRKREIVAAKTFNTNEEFEAAIRKRALREVTVVEGVEPALAVAIAEKPNHPAAFITWYEAMSFCAWLDARWRARGWLRGAQYVTLPTEVEWEKAARGGLTLTSSQSPASLAAWRERDPARLPRVDGLPNPIPRRRYPWGDDADLTRMNILATNILRTTGLGCFANGRSPYGCQDMAGNVEEWTRSLLGPIRFVHEQGTYQFPMAYPYPYRPDDGREDLSAGPDIGRVLRGGSLHGRAGSMRCAARNWNQPNHRPFNYGFRVVVSPFF